ncbi:MAG TPA: alpha-L-arabinofuranosidase C-terminal domain-containing protein [Bacteroidales bacterium]|nr:alpha-L-arabinofuranosidase C-terminal domain-containing protein [Bacteroidales bacterium]
MKKYYLFLLAAVLAFASCNKNKQEAGLIRNSSAEITDGSVVDGWTTDARSRYAVHFYDNVAHSGSKSLFIKADRYANGRWSTKVLLRPWSKYTFTGWVKTEGLESDRGKGAGFRLDGLKSDTIGFTGNTDWTQVKLDFETGNNDCTILSCLLDVSGRARGRAWFDDFKIDYVSSENIKTAVNINTAKASQPMPVYVYGQFIEHLGRCIYGGIWAEVLEDRKFWYAPGSRESAWRVSGNEKLFSMDEKEPYTGAHTPVLSSEKESKAILVQENLGLKENMNYSGHIVLRGTGGMNKASVILRCNGKDQEVSIDGITGNFASYPVSFKSTALVHDAVISVVPGAEGKLYVGTLTLMPDDNIDGFRSDVLGLLKELNAPVYRWPGGNFVSGYNWRDGIGDRDKRPPRKNPAWSGVENNDVGIHEFMRFCELLNTEAYIAVNAGLGSSDEAMAEVQYTNGAEDTPMGKLRSANGRLKPWHVKFWSIGNEMYGNWQLGHMSTEQFVMKNNDFSDRMRSVDPSIKLISVGDLGPWDKMILSNCADRMDYISEHFYKQDYHGGGLMTHVNQIPDAIRQKADAHRIYRDQIPALHGKDIRICMDEWNYWYGPHIYGELGTRYFYRDAMGIAAGLNEYSKNSDIIYMANYAQTVNVIGCIKTSTTHSVLDATGQVLKLYRHKFGFIPVEITGETRPLNIGATLTEAKDTLCLSVVNPTMEPVKFPVSISGNETSTSAEIWRVTAPDLMSTNEPGQKPVVVIEGPGKAEFSGKLEAGPASITIFRIAVK